MPISAKPRRSYEEFFGNPHVSEGWILIHLQPASVSFRINATWQILTVTYSNPPKKSGTASIHFLVFVGFDSNFYLFWACLSGRLYQPLVPRDVETWRRRRQWLRDAERLKIWRSKDSQDVTICLRYVFYILYIYIYMFTCLLFVYCIFTICLLCYAFTAGISNFKKCWCRSKSFSIVGMLPVTMVYPWRCLEMVRSYRQLPSKKMP